MKRIVTMTLVNTDTKDEDMKTNVAVRDMLELHGWKYTGNCNCGGQYSDKYELKVGDAGQQYMMKVRRSTFLLRRPDHNSYTKMPIAILKQTVDEIQGLGE